MKFSLSLKYNAVPEWQDKYINYTGLKKTVYALQAESLGNSSGEAGTTSAGKAGSSTGSEEESARNSKFNALSGVFKNSSQLFKKKNTEEKTYELQDMDSRSGAASLHDSNDPKDVFLRKLQDELAKIEEFYKLQEAQILIDYRKVLEEAQMNKIHIVDRDDMMSDAKSILSRKSSITEEIIKTANSFNLPIDVKRPALEHRETIMSGDEDDEDDHSFSQNSALLSDADINMETQSQITLKKKTTQLFVDLSQLKSYVELNRLGFTKITKKFDKVMGTDLRATMFDSGDFFKHSYTFSYSTITNLDDKLETAIDIYAKVTNKNTEACRTELRSLLREHIVWERTTVWKEMIGLETRANDIKGTATDAGAESQLFQLDFYSWPLPFSINLGFTKIENFKLPKFLNTSRTYKLIIIIAITIILCAVKTFNDEAEHRCMALLALVALLWATEAIPLFATSMLCPLLVVLFRVTKDDDGKVMGAADASSFMFENMWSSTISVLIGGFTLAAGLSKYNIARVAASYILSVAGDKPRWILLAIMSVALFLSMWISNVATPVLCYSLLSTVLRQLPHDAPLAKALILGVALACNIAGMSSPISSPQNVVAMQYLVDYNVGWGQWLGVSIPVSVIALVLVWGLLLLTFKVNTHKVAKMRPIREKFTIKQWFIIFVLVLTIILWCVLSQIQTTFGDAGEIAVIPFVLFFGTGLLTPSDISNFPWSIVILAMGSLALGKAVSSSGLLSTIATALQKKVMDYDIWVIMIIFGLLILVIGTFVSHTVSAIIIIPLVQEIGDSLSGKNSSVILIFGTALLSSCGMGLASSGFPNVTAISMTDEVGRRYLNVSTFITRGVPASLLAYVVVITVGYGVMKASL